MGPHQRPVPAPRKLTNSRLAQIVRVGEVVMGSVGRRWEWLISCAVFAAILIALVIALLLQDPISGSIP